MIYERKLSHLVSLIPYLQTAVANKFDWDIDTFDLYFQVFSDYSLLLKIDYPTNVEDSAAKNAALEYLLGLKEYSPITNQFLTIQEILLEEIPINL